ncbi:WG repeat-containing protein [uncultured Aquimarina sp.]|uniref:WG repeat-containing protein n=1 Tax=uncultured Aquimarina sp. TaxID=575652 RepID=UPI0026117ABF|nr:WG repeat-containing protein [uncultured Aquimarina sp.]
MKKLLFIYITVVICGCSNLSTKKSPELNEFITEFDDKPIEKIKEEVNKNIKQFESFTKFFDGSFANEIKKIGKEDERYESEFKIDTTGVSKSLLQFDNIIFSQEFEDYQSSLSFGFKNPEKRKPLELGQGVSQTFVPKKIYYHNKEVKTDSIANYEVDFIFSDNWGKAKIIDSVDVLFKVDYLKDYDVVEVSLENPVVNYQGGEIRLVKAQDNYVYVTLSDTIVSVTEMQAYNKDGKILDNSGSSNNGVAPDDSEDIFTEMLDYLKQIQKKLNNDDFKNTAEFQEYLRKNMNSLDFFHDNDGVFHKEYYYYGTVNSVKLYFAKETDTRETLFRAYNVKPFSNDDELFEMNTEDGLVFLNNKGETEISITGLDQGVAKIGGDFYEDNNYFYHLNRSKKSLDTLLVYDIMAFDNGLIGIQPEQKDDDITLFNSDNELINDKKYWNVREVGAILFGYRNEKWYIISAQGEERLVSGVNRVGDKLSDDRILVSNDSKYGFINTRGAIVIPVIYDDAKDFERGITAVKLGETYKLIDIRGKILLDTEEDDINFFGEDGDGNRIYKFGYGAKSYNYKGDLIEK